MVKVCSQQNSGWIEQDQEFSLADTLIQYQLFKIFSHPPILLPFFKVNNPHSLIDFNGIIYEVNICSLGTNIKNWPCTSESPSVSTANMSIGFFTNLVIQEDFKVMFLDNTVSEITVQSQ